jgi:hypothetical protein
MGAPILGEGVLHPRDGGSVPDKSQGSHLHSTSPNVRSTILIHVFLVFENVEIVRTFLAKLLSPKRISREIKKCVLSQTM